MIATPPAAAEPRRPRGSLRRKFIHMVLIAAGIIGGTTLAIVPLLNARASARHLAEIEASIELGITSKGKVLTENHALALRGMVLDNAFLEMQSLVARAVGDDPDLVYGLFVDFAGDVLAFKQRGKDDGERNAPRKDACQVLGLSHEGLVARRESVVRVQRLGQEVVEVAVPVLDDERAVLGMIRYGLSTRRMHQAILAADTDSKAQQARSVELIGAAVGLATLFGVLIGRIQAVRITEPVRALTRAASDLAAGDRSVRVTIRSGDELELLGASFNRMVAELSNSYEELECLNHTLEQKVQVRTLELAGRNRDMRLVLDNVDQGFITLSPDGVMASERSAVVERWFGECLAGEVFWRYLARSSPSFAAIFELAWEQLASGVLPDDVALDQLPFRLNLRRSTFEFRYLPFLREQQLEGVLVVVADITSELLREREEAEYAELTQGLRCMMLDRCGFTAFLKEASGTVEQLCERAATTDPEVLKNALHTLKGNARQMGLIVVAALCHGLEDELAGGSPLSPESLDRLSGRWQEVTAHVTQFFGSSEPNTVEITAADYTELVTLLSSSAQTQALHLVRSWQLEPASRALRRLADQALALAKQLGKSELEVVVEPTPLRLDSEVFGPLFSDLAHIVRNAVDHGIESADERQAADKPAMGRVAFSARLRGQSLIFEVTDDGAGIDWGSLRRKGDELGLPTRTPAELLIVLCHQGVSTNREVTQISGRGAGMSAVKQRIDAMHGTLEVESSRGIGTTWRITLPCAPEHATSRPSRFDDAAAH